VAFIRLHDISVEFPIYTGSSRSLKKMLLNTTTQGNIARDARAIPICIVHLGIQSRSAQDRLGRHAPDVQAGAAKQMTLDQCGLRAS